MNNELITPAQAFMAQGNKIEWTPTYLKIKKELTESEYEKLFMYLGHVGGKQMIFVGDLANQEGMVKNGIKSDFYKRIQEETGLKYGSIKVAKTVMGNIDLFDRLNRCGIAHYTLVYQMEPKQQKYWLEKCVNEKWSVSKLRSEIKKTIPTPKLPHGKYNVIYADPPWQYDFAGTRALEIEQHYPTMTVEQLCELNVKDLAADNCILFLWITSPKLSLFNTVMAAWGFEYKTSFIWDKIKHNIGYYCSIRHELLLIGGKGSSTPVCDWKTIENIDSVQSIEKTGHSEKPEEFYDIIETLYPGAKKVELFARSTRKGWDSWGNEL